MSVTNAIVPAEWMPSQQPQRSEAWSASSRSSMARRQGTPKPERQMKAPVRKTRCAVYTRVSADERLDMEFNSLDAQREAAISYIESQKHERWLLVPDRYDDGGFSGGTMERPG